MKNLYCSFFEHFDMNINNFSIDKSDDVIKQTNNLVGYIEKKINTKNFSSLAFLISNSFNLPIYVTKFEIKKHLTDNHNFRVGKFSNKFKLINLFTSSIQYIFSFIFIFIFSLNSKKIKKSEIIFDEVLSNEELERSYLILNKFISHTIITSQKLKNLENCFIYRKQIGASRQFIKKHFFSIIFKNLIKSIKLSFKEKANMIPFLLDQTKKIIKYETVFQKFRAKFLIQERPYTTSAIKNYLFKKYGGKKTCCTQRIIFHLGSTSFYINSDILFSLGNETAKILELTGSKIEKINPVGSTVFSSKWIKSEKLKTEYFDIIHLSGNDAPYFMTDNNYLDNYYKQLRWLKKLSIDFPNLKIVVKHHEGNKFNDQKEISILKSANIKRISGPTNPGKANYSYGYAINSSLRLTWCSTMAYELIGHGYPCYFLDPKMQNNAFLHNYNFNKKFRIANYERLKLIVNEMINKKQNKNINNKESFCINSFNVEEKIYSGLKDY